VATLLSSALGLRVVHLQLVLVVQTHPLGCRAVGLPLPPAAPVHGQAQQRGAVVRLVEEEELHGLRRTTQLRGQRVGTRPSQHPSAEGHPVPEVCCGGPGRQLSPVPLAPRGRWESVSEAGGSEAQGPS